MTYDRTAALIEKLETSISYARERFAERNASSTHLSMALSAAASVRKAAHRLERHLRDELNGTLEVTP